jgi:hypothetical protein
MIESAETIRSRLLEKRCGCILLSCLTYWFRVSGGSRRHVLYRAAQLILGYLLSEELLTYPLDGRLP